MTLAWGLVGEIQIGAMDLGDFQPQCRFKNISANGSQKMHSELYS